MRIGPRSPLVAVLAGTLLLTGCVGIGGESISLTHGELRTPERPASGRLDLRRPASDHRGDRSRIGRATITVFAITSGNVTTRTPVVEEIVGPVKTALETAGYEVVLVPEGASGSPSWPTLEVRIEKLYFRNYNWFWPIVPTWGDIELALVLRDARGSTVFEESFEGDGTSFCLIGRCAFGGATKRALTEVLDSIVQTVTSEHFQQMLRAAPQTYGMRQGRACFARAYCPAGTSRKVGE